jgi:hypothetical protein
VSEPDREDDPEGEGSATREPRAWAYLVALFLVGGIAFVLFDWLTRTGATLVPVIIFGFALWGTVRTFERNRHLAAYVGAITESGSLHEQVSTNLANVEALAHFAGKRLWLTFYLTGPPERLKQVAETLDAEGWQNTGDWEGAFLYPKVQVDRTAEAIVDVARSVQALCQRHAVEVLNIDADTSPDVSRSQFMTLYRSDS